MNPIRPEVPSTIEVSVRTRASSLLELSHAIHGAQELAYDEHRSARLLRDFLASCGLPVTTAAYGLPTAVQSIVGDGDLRIVLCAEYDALPEIGHGCGHNIIAAAAAGAAVALAPLVEQLGITLVLLGTPAEEHGGGKALLLDLGAWDGAHMSLMAHPVVASDDVRCRDVQMSAVARFEIDFRGRSSHAAAAPERGRNAADAAVIGQVALGLLRQQAPEGTRMNAVVREGGGATNIIPEHSTVALEVRAPDNAALDALIPRALACFEGGAVAAGCSISVAESEPRYDALEQDERIGAYWDAALTQVRGQTLAARPHRGGSTDMGNVSRVVPSIHPYIAIRGEGQANPHSREFAAAAVTRSADQTVLDAARALAETIASVAADTVLRDELIRPKQ